MAKVRTLSQAFPSYHVEAGKPTNFVEKVWTSLIDSEQMSISKGYELSRQTGIGAMDIYKFRARIFDAKNHTIRAGKHFKKHDTVQLAVWSGKPYRSKQIKICFVLDVVTYDFEIKADGAILIDGVTLPEKNTNLQVIAHNDGLTLPQFNSWFRLDKKVIQPFSGQIICWNPNIKY